MTSTSRPADVEHGERGYRSRRRVAGALDHVGARPARRSTHGSRDARRLARGGRSSRRRRAALHRGGAGREPRPRRGGLRWRGAGRRRRARQDPERPGAPGAAPRGGSPRRSLVLVSPTMAARRPNQASSGRRAGGGSRAGRRGSAAARRGASYSSAGRRQVDSSTPEATSRSTMRGSAGLTTAIWQVGHRNRYAPELSSMHTRTRTSAVVSSTSPQSRTWLGWSASPAPLPRDSTKSMFRPPGDRRLSDFVDCFEGDGPNGPLGVRFADARRRVARIRRPRTSITSRRRTARRSARPGAHRQLLGPGLPAGRQRRRRAGRRRGPRRGPSAEGVGLAGRHQPGVDAVGGDVAVAVDVGGHDRRAGGHRLEQHDAEGLTPQRRRAEDVGAAPCGAASRRRRPARATRCGGRGARGRSVVGVGPVAGDPEPDSAGSRSTAPRRTSRPLRGSWRPTKKTVGPSVGHGSALAHRSTSTPLNSRCSRRRGSGRRGRRRRRTPRSGGRGGRRASAASGRRYL